MNKNEYLNNFYKHVSTDSILVVTSKGELIRLYCPFTVKSLVSFPGIPEGSICQVIRVQITPELKDVYNVNGKFYLSMFFEIFKDESFIKNYFNREIAKPIKTTENQEKSRLFPTASIIWAYGSSSD